MKNLKQYFTLVLVHILLVLFGVRVAGAQCLFILPSVGCPAPNPADPLSQAQFNLFPIPGFQIVDNGPGDLDPTCGVISVTDVPIPTAPFATFSGDIVFQQPQGSQPGELRVTNATIDNPEGNPILLTVLEFACGEFYWVTPPPPNFLGFLRTEIDGRLLTEEPPTAGGEELEFTATGLSLTIPAGPGGIPPPEHPAEVMASWIAGGPADPPVPMNAFAQKEGRFTSGVGLIGLRMNVNLPPGETMLLPNSEGDV